jgi:large subunit ribosomal protein L7Ae
MISASIFEPRKHNTYVHLLTQDQREFSKLTETFKAMYNDGPRVHWGGHILGPKSQVKHKKRERAIAKELAQRQNL